MQVSMPCLKCGVTNILSLDDTTSIMYLCPSCHVGTAYLSGVVYNFRESFIKRMISKYNLVISGDVTNTDNRNRFAKVQSRIKGSDAPQKGSPVTGEYLEDLRRSLVGAKTVDEILKCIEYPETRQENSP
jgi:hypothetical protein